jgi:hypothetical protein
MKTLLHNKATRSYFQEPGRWSKDADEAFDFKLTERVIRFVREAGLDASQFELIVAFDDPGLNITLPIDERFSVNTPPYLLSANRDSLRD